MNKLNIGIIGLGYVGKACKEVFSSFFNVLSYDINNSGSEASIKDLVNKSDILFLCLPTPMNKDGSCNISIIENVLSEVSGYKDSICVIKSTITPGSSDFFEKKFNNLKIFFNPEFLTEANFINDFKTQDRIIIGSSDDMGAIYYSKIVDIYTEAFPGVKIIKLSLKEAELVKYFTNSFLALKVSYANEFFRLCKKLDIDYYSVLDVATLDKRIGKSHFTVPGPDGKFGFGGACFPKDLNAIIDVFKKNGLDPHLLEAAWKRNISEDRPEKDWEKLVGRAVVEDE
tara:strand:+ start:56 stop:910 length:855 start_codon:yes stop_codon:yes gene_type:complete